LTGLACSLPKHIQYSTGLKGCIKLDKKYYNNNNKVLKEKVINFLKEGRKVNPEPISLISNAREF
jgi:oligoendopeptidase F